jgi:hypothetical protein
MKKLIGLMMAMASATVFAQGQLMPMPEAADPVTDGYYHAPQYLPYFPTAATMWPRVVEVPCQEVSGKMLCDQINWTPDFGRGEYVYLKPLKKAAPVVIERQVPVYVEKKKIKE